MSIAFACGSCGKSFTVPDKLAGKTGRCKGCNNPISIPVAVSSHSAPSAPRQVSRSGADRPTPAAEPIYGLEAESKYGLEEAVEVLPARTHQAPSRGDDASGRVKKKRTGSKSGFSPKRRIFPIILGVVGLLTLGVFIVSIRQGLAEDEAAKAEVVKVFRELVGLNTEFANLLAKVQDATIAEAESARAHSLLLKMQGKRLKLRDLLFGDRNQAKAVTQADLLAHKAVVDRGSKEIARIQDTYGAWEALNIEKLLVEINGIKVIESVPSQN